MVCFKSSRLSILLGIESLQRQFLASLPLAIVATGIIYFSPSFLYRLEADSVAGILLGETNIINPIKSRDWRLLPLYSTQVRVQLIKPPRNCFFGDKTVFDSCGERGRDTFPCFFYFKLSHKIAYTVLQGLSVTTGHLDVKWRLFSVVHWEKRKCKIPRATIVIFQLGFSVEFYFGKEIFLSLADI